MLTIYRNTAITQKTTIHVFLQEDMPDGEMVFYYKGKHT
jgi:hypothetical protein